MNKIICRVGGFVTFFFSSILILYVQLGSFLNSVLSSLYIFKGVVEEWNYVLLNYKEVGVIHHKETKISVAVIFYKQLHKLKVRYLFQTFAVH